MSAVMSDITFYLANRSPLSQTAQKNLKSKRYIIMKKFDLFKTIQLILFIALAAAGLYIIFTDHELYQMIASNTHIRLLCILLWAALVLSFLFIFMDFSLFSSFKKDYRELDYAISSDPVSGIANRYSCDSVIEKYLDKPLPEHLGCIMFDLSNIKTINHLWGHLKGNELIREFSNILQTASNGLCFVGRNGGSKFLALFENCSTRKMEQFLSDVDKKVKHHNTRPDSPPIQYRYGSACREEEDIKTITELIGLSDHRIYNRKTEPLDPEK